MIPTNIKRAKKRAFGGTYVRWSMNICSMAYEHMFVNQGSWLRKPTNICSFFRGYSTCMLRALVMTFYLLFKSVCRTHILYHILFHCYFLRVAAIGGADDING